MLLRSGQALQQVRSGRQRAYFEKLAECGGQLFPGRIEQDTGVPLEDDAKLRDFVFEHRAAAGNVRWSKLHGL